MDKPRTPPDFTIHYSSMWRAGDKALCISLWPPNFKRPSSFINSPPLEIGHTYLVNQVIHCTCSTRLILAEFKDPSPESNWYCWNCSDEIGWCFVSTCFMKIDPEWQAKLDAHEGAMDLRHRIHNWLKQEVPQEFHHLMVEPKDGRPRHR